MKKTNVALLVGGALLFTGCCKKLEWVSCCDTKQQPKKQVKVTKPVVKTVKLGNQECLIQNGQKKECIINIEASGVGVAPCDDACSKAQAQAMARRAAVLDAYKALAEKLYGAKINGRDTVKNMVLQSSSLKSYVSGIIRGADIEDESFKDGMYKVVLSLKMDANMWKKIMDKYYNSVLAN